MPLGNIFASDHGVSRLSCDYENSPEGGTGKEPESGMGFQI